MNTKTVADNQSKALQSKLNAAIASRASLEEDFKAQSSMLIDFINKLSQVSKGINVQLDNKLAQLRGLLTKSAPVSDIELKITDISKLLQKHTVTNEQNISQLHEQFNSAGQNLQKVSGLPNDLRRRLRGLLTEAKSTKESLPQYIPMLTQLLEFYNLAIQTKTGMPSTEPSKEPSQNSLATDDTSSSIVNSALIEQISSCLSKLKLSTQHTKELLEINKKLLKDTTNDDVLKRFIEIFDVIVDDLKSERDSAQNFLNTLNETLSTVQNAVKTTLSTCKDAQFTNDIINKKLQEQLIDMTGSLKEALSLDQVKIDINGKLNSIAQTLEKKTKFEQKNQQALANQLTEMAKKVEKLEHQSQQFEEKLAEQQRKNMQDALTKLSNRAAFDEFFTQSMVRFHHKPYDLALAVVDIDDFKNINDTYGHTAGDKTLQVIAKTILKIASKDAFVARYGGEEFVLIYSSQKEATFIKELNNINTSIGRLPFKFKNNKVCITLSIGATHINKEDNIHTAFERADEAMYKAKAQGKNQVIYFN
jgi:diguanylate cyclase (GGDEF)-like protein